MIGESDGLQQIMVTELLKVVLQEVLYLIQTSKLLVTYQLEVLPVLKVFGRGQILQIFTVNFLLVGIKMEIQATDN